LKQNGAWKLNLRHRKLVNTPSLCSHVILHRNIEQKLVNSLHGLLNFEIGGLDGRVVPT